MLILVARPVSFMPAGGPQGFAHAACCRARGSPGGAEPATVGCLSEARPVGRVPRPAPVEVLACVGQPTVTAPADNPFEARQVRGSSLGGSRKCSRFFFFFRAVFGQGHTFEGQMWPFGAARYPFKV